jgi:anti-anti-sigma factor
MNGYYQLLVSNVTSSTISLRVAGEVDMAAAPVLIDAILGASSSNPTYEVVVDLDDVTFIDSMGLAALIEAHRRLIDQGVSLVIHSVSPTVRKLMDITGTAEHLGVDPSTPSNSVPA